MSSELEDLQIEKDELENLTEIDYLTSLSIDLYRALAFRDSRYILSVIINNLGLFIVSLITVLPITSIVLFRSGNYTNNTAGFLNLLLIVTCIAIVALIIGNIYLWQKSRKFKFLATLIDKLEKYNHSIRELILLDQISSLNHLDRQQDYVHNKQAIINALQITRDSLIKSLQIEKLIRKHHQVVAIRHELFTNLESNLVSLMSFDSSDRTDEYEQLLNEVLQIGLSVHKEIRKLQN